MKFEGEFLMIKEMAQKFYKQIKHTLLGVFIVLMAGLLVFTGCNSQYAARKFGGTTTVLLPAGKKIVNVTWKDSHLWYLMRPKHVGETAEVWEFHEDALFGMLNGTVLLKEQD